MDGRINYRFQNFRVCRDCFRVHKNKTEEGTTYLCTIASNAVVFGLNVCDEHLYPWEGESDEEKKEDK